MQLNQDSPSIQDSGEICEVSTTVDKDEESEDRNRKTTPQDEVIDVETEEKAKEVKSEPQVKMFKKFSHTTEFLHVYVR